VRLSLSFQLTELSRWMSDVFAGDLLHMDTSEYARFQRPGHRVTGDVEARTQHIDGVGVVHAIVDDHSRFAYAEIHDDQKAVTAVGFLEGALAYYEPRGNTPGD
jgi:Integrase core domain